MPIDYSKRTLTHNKREAWVPKELDEMFRMIQPNYQSWVLTKMEEETNKMIIRDHEIAFKNAISKGLKNPQDYMYMYSDESKDYFKHIDTRKYVEFNIR